MIGGRIALAVSDPLPSEPFNGVLVPDFAGRRVGEH